MLFGCVLVLGVVILKDPLARVTSFAKALGPKTATVQSNVRQTRLAQFSKRWHDVREIDKVIALDPGRNGFRAVDDQGCMTSSVGRVGLFPLPRFALVGIVQTRVCPVVGGEDHNRVVAQAVPVECVNQPANAFVHVADHVTIVFTCVSVVAIRAVGSWQERRMNRQHRIVRKERAIPVLLNEVNQKTGAKVRTVRILGHGKLFSVLNQAGIPVPCAFCPGIVPQAERIKATLRSESALVAVQLPFPCDRRRVTSFFHHRSKRDLTRIEFSKDRVVPNVVPTGHDLDPTRSADGLRITVIELDSGSSELVQSRCLEVLTAVATNVVIGDVIRHDQNDVGLSGVSG